VVLPTTPKTCPYREWSEDKQEKPVACRNPPYCFYGGGNNPLWLLGPKVIAQLVGVLLIIYSLEEKNIYSNAIVAICVPVRANRNVDCFCRVYHPRPDFLNTKNNPAPTTKMMRIKGTRFSGFLASSIAALISGVTTFSKSKNFEFESGGYVGFELLLISVVFVIKDGFGCGK